MHRSAGFAHRLIRQRTTIARPSVIALVIAFLLLPLLAEPVQGASTTTRLDWGSKAPMPTRRIALGFAAAPNGKLYAVGGGGGSSPGCPPPANPPAARHCTALEEYDPATDTWATR